ncbi:MAG: dethiobiotin synthase [Chitinophagaceae bacterium]|nr:dethiobiotin synthase [Chitinophagaceae bacterium]
MNSPVFITGTGTGVGKTLVAAVVTEALQAGYWKPVQAGFENGTDAEWVRQHLSNNISVVYPELYKLKLPASPHIAAREEGARISSDKIVEEYRLLVPGKGQLVIEGAGGLMVPLNNDEMVLHLIKKLSAKVIVVSRNYLGSINHSLLTAGVLKANQVDVAGWIFNDQYMNYEEEIAEWSGYPVIGKIPYSDNIDRNFVAKQAERIRPALLNLL